MSQTISLNDIKVFSECPRLYEFYKVNTKLLTTSSRLSITQSIIQEAFLEAMETGYRVEWRKIVHLVSTQVLLSIGLDQPEKTKKMSEYILMSLQKWYYKIYLESNIETFVDLPMKTILCKRTIYDTIPIVQLSQQPIITVLTEKTNGPLRLFNDITVRGMAWLVMKELNCEEIICKELQIGEQGALEVSEINVTKEDSQRTEDVLQQIVSSMSAGIHYPAVTNQCGACIFYRRCRI